MKPNYIFVFMIALPIVFFILSVDRFNFTSITKAQAQPIEVYCLAETIYFESRGEPYLGKVAVGHVVKNRAERSGESICSTVRKPAQFSVAHKFGTAKTERDQWEESKHLAAKVLRDEVPDPTGGAEWFHAIYVQPYWAKSKKLALEIGNHLFYTRKDNTHQQ